jgi:xylan 1,4-beta-xylosidase
VHLPSAKRDLKVEHFRIDEEHSNAFAAWKRIGSPQSPTPAEYAQLEKAGQLTALGEPKTVRVEDGAARIEFKLPQQAVSLITLE